MSKAMMRSNPLGASRCRGADHASGRARENRTDGFTGGGVEGGDAAVGLHDKDARGG